MYVCWGLNILHISEDNRLLAISRKNGGDGTVFICREECL